MMSTMKLVTRDDHGEQHDDALHGDEVAGRRYWASWKPRPFHSKVVSVSTAPPSSSAICRPMTVMIGISAGGRRACAPAGTR